MTDGRRTYERERERERNVPAINYGVNVIKYRNGQREREGERTNEKNGTDPNQTRENNEKIKL